jgi:cystathionine beta-lyase/cystathionine gamma-synthase
VSNLDKERWDAATIAVRGNRKHDGHADAMLFPLYQSATFRHETVGAAQDHSYSRVSNPTVEALELALASLERAKGAVCFRTGMAAITTMIFSLVKTGDHVIVSEIVYGGTTRLFDEVLHGLGIESSFIDTGDLEAVAAAVRPNTKLILIETPGNPTLRLTDIAATAEIARRCGALLALDNTFLTSLAQDVFELGADISVLSTTKYIDGHNATVGGSLATNDEKLVERFRLIRKTFGTIQAPFDAWLTLQGLRTLPARLKIQFENAVEIARWLEGHPLVERVYFPGLNNFPQKALAEKQQKGYGAMISFELKASVEESLAFMNSLQLISRAESLGSVESLMTHPASATHADVPVEIRQRLGVTDRLIRMSVGIESVHDILADIEQALSSIKSSQTVAGGIR